MRDSPVSRALAALLRTCALAPLWLAACVSDSGPIGPDVGSLSITTTTSGPRPDPDGYSVSVDGVPGRAIDINATFVLPDLTPGTYSVQLGGVAGNCTVSEGEARTVALEADATAEVTFAVTCVAAGAINIVATTSGTEPDADGYSVKVDGMAGQPIGINGTLRVPDLTPGDHSLELAAVASNCTVSGGATRTVAVAADGTTEVAFAVTCTTGGGGGSIGVTTTTTGPEPDPDGYSVSVDGAAAQPIGTNATLLLPNLTPGDHSVQLAGVASNCTVSDGAARTVAVTEGATTAVPFAVTCGPPPEPPTARLTITAPGGASVSEGGQLEITVPGGTFVSLDFDASRTEPGAGLTITAYDWRSNGVTIGTEPAFTHDLDEGTYVITLEVTNSAGLSHIASATLDIVE